MGTLFKPKQPAPPPPEPPAEWKDGQFATTLEALGLADELKQISAMRKGMPRTKAMKAWEEKRAEFERAKFERAKLMRHFE